MNLLLKKSGGLQRFFKKDYKLFNNDSPCCTLSFHNWKHVDYTIGETHYVIHSDGKSKWVLEQSGIKIASCKRSSSGPQQSFSIEFDSQVWRLKPNRKKLVLIHEVLEEDFKIGQITPHIKLWWPEITATFKETQRLEIVSLAVWLVGIHWVGVAGTFTAGRADIGI